MVGRHPSALLLNRDGSGLFVASASTDSIAVIDTKKLRVLTTLSDPPPAGPKQGSTPNALALSNDGSRLFVAEADNNAVAVFQLSAGVGHRRSRLLGRIPVEWYPTSLLMTPDSLFVLNGKGKGTRSNPQFPTPEKKLPDDSVDYTLGQLNGTLTVVPAKMKPSEFTRLTRRVARANNWDQARKPGAKYPPFKHVIYIIKENRTYDQIMGDLPQGDGDAWNKARAVSEERGSRGAVAVFLHEHRIAGIKQNARGYIKRLLGAGDDDDLICLALYAA
jgi:hypothetical protein